jgi:hypothetical protein
MSKSTKSRRNKWLTSPAPGAFDERIEELSRQIPTLFPVTSLMDDFELRTARFKRDLIYIGEASDTEQETHYCMEFALEMNFGVRRVPSMLDMSLNLNRHLRRRINDLVRCHVQEPIRTRPTAASHDQDPQGPNERPTAASHDQDPQGPNERRH